MKAFQIFNSSTWAAEAETETEKTPQQGDFEVSIHEEKNVFKVGFVFVIKLNNVL